MKLDAMEKKTKRFSYLRPKLGEQNTTFLREELTAFLPAITIITAAISTSMLAYTPFDIQTGKYQYRPIRTL